MSLGKQTEQIFTNKQTRLEEHCATKSDGKRAEVLEIFIRVIRVIRG